MNLLQVIRNVVGRRQKLLISNDPLGEDLSAVKVIFENQEGISIGKFKINLFDVPEETIAHMIDDESSVLDIINHDS
jgi:histidinol phosphatase-like enzyme